MMNKKELNERQYLEFINFYIEAVEGGYQIITRSSKDLSFNGVEIYDNAEDFVNELGNIEDLDIRSFSKSKQNKNRYYLVLGNGEELEIELI